MAQVVHQHHGHFESFSLDALYKAAIVCLALVAIVAFYLAVSTTPVSESEAPVLPPMFPLMPLL